LLYSFPKGAEWVDVELTVVKTGQLEPDGHLLAMFYCSIYKQGFGIYWN